MNKIVVYMDAMGTVLEIESSEPADMVFVYQDAGSKHEMQTLAGNIEKVHIDHFTVGQEDRVKCSYLTNDCRLFKEAIAIADHIERIAP